MKITQNCSRFLLLVIILGFAMCAVLLPPAAQAKKLNVVTSTTDMAALTQEVGGDKISVESIAKGYQDPHFVEAKPSFLLKLRQADLLVTVGLQLEIGWLPPLITQSGNPRIQVGANGYLDASQFAEILEIPTGTVTRAEGDVHPLGNPHYWLDPDNGRRIAKGIAGKLAEMDAADSSYFQQRFQDFDKRLTAAEQKWDAEMKPFRGRKVVTYHRSLPNFAKHFGLDVVGYVEPRPGIPPTPSHTIELIGLMKRETCKIVLVEPYFDLKTPNSIASLILTGIHAYLGVHVVERGVIFVDLALAQIAALGATIAILVGMDPHGQGAYWLSLAFTFIGAAIFAFARTRRGHIPQEAFIGIAYAVASAMAILLMSKATGETEHLKDMLVGNILAVSRHDVIKTAVLYGVIGLFHYIFRRRFLLISTDPEQAEEQGMSIRFWDFLFYASFGLVVTSSVAIAGVLLVFCYLIVPSVGAMLFADRVGRRLAIGWTMGTLVSALGVYFSVLLDLPTGATIVCTFGAVLVVMFFIYLFLRKHPSAVPEATRSLPNHKEVLVERSR